MTPAEQARAMGDYIREHGFSPSMAEPDSRCGCFINAWVHVESNDWWLMWEALSKTTGAASYHDHDLIAAGYASDADRQKAVDACYAAAQLLEGK